MKKDEIMIINQNIEEALISQVFISLYQENIKRRKTLTKDIEKNRKKYGWKFHQSKNQ